VHKQRFGVEPMCGVLGQHGVAIAPSTFYAARTRAPSKRAQRDEAVLIEIRRVHGDAGLGRVCMGCARCGISSAGKRSLVGRSGRWVPLPAVRWSG